MDDGRPAAVPPRQDPGVIMEEAVGRAFDVAMAVGHHEIVAVLRGEEPLGTRLLDLSPFDKGLRRRARSFIGRDRAASIGRAWGTRW
jgi:hypothetical protein